MKLTQPSLSSPAAPVVSALALNASTGGGLVRSGLVAEYRFDEGSGQVLHDYSGNNNHGTFGTTSGSDTNDPTWISSGLSFATNDYIPIGAAAVGGVTQPLGAAHIVFYTATPITKSTTGMYLLFWRATDSTGLLGLGSLTSLLTDEIILLSVGASKRCGWCGDDSIAPGWHVLTFNTTTVGWYTITLDGVSKTLTTTGVSPAPYAMDNLTIGATNAGGSPFTGYVAYLSIYNRALTASEIASNTKYIEDYLKVTRGIAKNP